MYRLEKLSIDKGSSSVVHAGHTQSGNYLRRFIHNTEQIEEITDFKQVEVGWQILLTRGITGWLNTSPIKEIIERTSDSVTFHTQTSIYIN